ncbi:EamA family transporter [Xenorhabdus hominickii]|uniref:Membrane protein n=1 Tax=Xenorhabdus hominickii TaxID=351679 RepID=A0A2G0Q4W8_XENHO|nr:EamA family transporter [Xenorhabdus hominickii]AOM40095.1 hypothetical protein A9255_05595 [Xenorhabdus hominickii]PHM54268.1 membrane protein [Xenorhabdus hominickii]
MKIIDLLAALLITLIWGLNFSVIKLGLNTLDPFLLAGLRFSLCAFPAIFFIRRPDVPMKIVALYGIIFGVGLWGMVNLSVKMGVSAGVSSLLLQFSAFLTIIMGCIFLKERIHRHQMLGFILALTGLGFILRLTDGSITLWGVIIVLFGATSWSIANVIMKKNKSKNVFSFLVWSCLFAPLPLFLMGYITNGSFAFSNLGENLNAMTIFSVLFQAYPTTLIGYWVWNSLLSKYPVSSVAPLSLLVPIFGFVGSTIIFGETISIDKITSCILILAGLVMSLYGKQFHKVYD